MYMTSSPKSDLLFEIRWIDQLAKIGGSLNLFKKRQPDGIFIKLSRLAVRTGIGPVVSNIFAY
jgi:hypothetical protein